MAERDRPGDASGEAETPGDVPSPRKPVRWWGASRRDLRSFPAEVRTDIGFNLDLVQRGQMPEHFDYLSAIGSGVIEIKVNYDRDTYRTLYVAKFEEAVYVLHAFQKKSTKGKQMPKKERELAAKRYAEVVAHRRAAGLS